MIPYARQQIDADDIEAVVRVLRSDYLTTGPTVGRFEEALAAATGADHVVVMASGTAALHAAMHALDIQPGDEVVVPVMTFVATANAVVFCGGTPRFVDVDPNTLLIDLESLETVIGPRTKAIVAVDYAGHPCAYGGLREIASRHGVALVADAAHSLGGLYRGQPVGSLADLSVFSFHPVKHVATGEGGAVATSSRSLSDVMRRFRNHGLDKDHTQRAQTSTWDYGMQVLGYNYRLSDLHCALGISQLKKLRASVLRRCEIAAHYNAAFADLPGWSPLAADPDVTHAYHLYVVRLRDSVHREEAFRSMREAGVGVNVHYKPVHLQPFYMERFATKKGQHPVSEAAYETILTLPMYPGLTDEQVDEVLRVARSVG